MERARTYADLDGTYASPDGNWEPKAWGRVRHLFYSRDVGLSLLEVTAGTRCSCHFHAARWNHFLSVSATIVVETWLGLSRNSYRSQKVLTPGESLAVPAGVLHRFRVLEAGNVVETYWPINSQPVRMEDIVRLDEGGPDDLVALRRELGLGD